MRKLFFISLFLILSIGIQAQEAQQDFTLVNSTGLVIDELYVSPSESEEWDEDVLGKEVLRVDEECDILFNPKEEVCLWDIKITDEEGDEIEWEKIDLCKAVRVILYWKDGKAWADIEEVEQ